MLELTVDQSNLVRVSKLMRAEYNGKRLKLDLIAEFKTIVGPGIAAVQGKLRAIPHETARETSPALGTYLADRVKLSVRLGGASAGVKIRIAQTPNLRGFKLAGRRLNRVSWRHRIFGSDVWVEQTSPIPNYFDETLMSYKAEYTDAVLAACRRMAFRIAGERL
jgi:hypothetical protein